MVLSDKGWVRAAKGTMSAPPSSVTSRRRLPARSSQAAQQPAGGVLDSAGRSYSLAAHTCRRHVARVNCSLAVSVHRPGSPLSLCSAESRTSGGCWPRTRVTASAFRGEAPAGQQEEAGKAALSLPPGARVLRPSPITDADTDRLVTVTSDGRMLVIPANDLPELTRGKGNKIIGIPPKAVADRTEYVIDILAVPDGGKVRLNSGKRYLNLRAADLTPTRVKRGQRGNKLPRGFQKVDGVELINEPARPSASTTINRGTQA